MLNIGITPDLEALYKAQDEADRPVPCQNYPDMFFPDPANRSVDGRLAKNMCRECPIIRQCAEYGMKNEEFGIWGGLTPEDRRRLRGWAA